MNSIRPRRAKPRARTWFTWGGTALAGLLALAGPARSNGVFDANFLHQAHSGTLNSNWTELANPFTDAAPAETLFVTPNQNPGGTSVLELQAIGVWYDGLRWNIFHQDAATPIATGTSYNVLVPHPNADTFVHTASAGNIVGNYTLIDHASLNGDPNGVMIVTQNWNPPRSGGVYNDHEIGVFYSVSDSRWGVFNQDGATMPTGASFNVMVVSGLRVSQVHTADTHNTTGNRTSLDDPSLNGNPDALVQVTQNWNPGLGPGVYNDNPIGVFYDPVTQRWTITNMSGLAIPLGASWNVLAPPEFEDQWVHASTTANLGPGRTTLSHPLIDDELWPILLTTAHLDFVGFGTGYPLDPTALAFDVPLGRWYLKNQIGPSWAAGTYTNVYLPPVNLRALVHKAGVGNPQFTIVRHPLLDGDTGAIFFVQPHMNPAAGTLVTIPERVGVVWFDFNGEILWTIENEPLALAVADGASYNVFIPPASMGAFKHTTDPLDGSFTVLDNPLLNGDSYARILVTHNIADSNGTLDKTLGVRYDYALQRWKIATVDNSPIGDNTFNVLPIPVPEPDPALAWLSGIALLIALGRLRTRGVRR